MAQGPERKPRRQAAEEERFSASTRVLGELTEIMSRVAEGDFSRMPELPESDDEIAQFILAFRFMIEDLERFHRERADRIARLQDLDRLQNRFINVAAHELGTPLTPIQMQLHLLLNDPDLQSLRPDQQRALEILDRNVRRLVHLVGDILDSARIQSGHLNVARKAFEIEPVVADAAESFRAACQRKGIRLELDQRPAGRVRGDANRIVQVLFNLLSNAVKFTPTGGRIRVSCRGRASRVIIEVTDDGAGMTAEQMARLFRPFTQVHDELGGVTGGTGLGLFICKGIVEAHDGMIECESAGPGQGTTFRVTLPRDTEPADG
jgi:signal transduction histidine kinase